MEFRRLSVVLAIFEMILAEHMSKNLSNQHKIIIRGLILNAVTNAPIIIGFLVIAATKGPLTSSSFSLGAFIAGFSGVIIMFRREIPTSLVAIRGNAAVVFGILLTGLMWVSAIAVYIMGLR